MPRCARAGGVTSLPSYALDLLKSGELGRSALRKNAGALQRRPADERGEARIDVRTARPRDLGSPGSP